MRRIPIFAAALVWAAILHGAETPIPAPPTQWVTDTANFLSPETVRTLNTRLADYERRTGHQVIVYIAPTTGDAPIDDWAVRAFAKWKVGRKGLDDGLALFIMSNDRRARIEVGYGLEAVVPDAIASRVINEVIVPRIQAGQHDEAVTSAIDSLIGVIDKQPGALPAETPAPEHTSLRGLGSILGMLILGLLITNPRLMLFFLTAIMSGGRGTVRRGGGGVGWGGGGIGWGGGGGGFGWGGGGGFGGGGGRSGGGGASGSW